MAADEQEQTEQQRPNNSEEVLPVCGLIMPISATSNQSAEHWRKVRTLISRAIQKAKFQPLPVWENVSNDRVSERIIGNIFKFPMVVVDISDANPNVMLEFGLRLASRKPTIAIINDGGVIPFDIRDFHALHYPPSLSILEMEEFIDKLCENIKSLYRASQEVGYTPFLGNVVVDVVSPSEREVSANQFLLDRLDSIERKISSARSLSSNDRSMTYISPGLVAVTRTPNETLLFFDLTESRDDSKRAFFTYDFSSITSRVKHLSAIGDTGKRNCYALVLNGNVDGAELNKILSSVKSMCDVLGVTLGVDQDQIRAEWMNTNT